MKHVLFRSVAKRALASATLGLMVFSVVAEAQSTPTPTPLPAPERQGGSLNSEFAFVSDYNEARVQASRAVFLQKAGLQETNYDAARKFAACAIDLNEARARSLLDQATGKGDKSLTLGKFLNRYQGCVVAQIAMDRDFLRAALAERILIGAEPAVSIPAPGDSSQVTKFIEALPAANAKADDPFTVGQIEAECRVGFSPVQARAVLATEPGSPQEAGALAVWKAVTPQCDSFKVADKPLTSWFERAFAAQALYHWISVAPEISKN